MFVSYAREDVEWARWLESVLEDRGFNVEISTHWPLGDNAIERMNAALLAADYVVGVWSPSHFLAARWSSVELQAATRLAFQRRLAYVPVIVEPCEPPPLNAAYVDLWLVGATEAEALALIDERFPSPHRSSVVGARVPYPGVVRPHHSVPADAVVSQLTGATADAGRVGHFVRRADGFDFEEMSENTQFWAQAGGWEPASTVLRGSSEGYRAVTRAIEGCHNPSDLLRLFRLASRLEGILAYAALDLGLPDKAVIFAEASRRTAKGNGDISQQAWALGTQALIARYGNDHDRALRAIHAGLQLDVHGAARSRLYSGASLSYAALADGGATESALELAETAMADGDGDEAAVGILRFSTAKLHYYAGNALSDLGMPSVAEEAEHQCAIAVERFRELSVEERSYPDEVGAYLLMALARLGTEHPERSLEALDPLLSLPAHLRTAWHKRYLRKLASRAADLTDAPDGLAEQLQTVADGFEIGGVPDD